MFRRIEIKLRLPMVLPLIDILRSQGAKIEGQQQSESQRESKRAQVNMVEVAALLTLFDQAFLKTGAIIVAENECPTLLRACSLFRLQLLHNSPPEVSDAISTMSLDPNRYFDGKHDSIACYIFLATFQETLLQNFEFPGEGLTFSDYVAKHWSPLVHWFRSRRRSPAGPFISGNGDTHTSRESWQVIVLNDPVNLMTYVTAVFQSVLALPKDVAQQRMREVHELEKSMVWEGAKEQAEAYACALQAWHLEAVVQQAPN